MKFYSKLNTEQTSSLSETIEDSLNAFLLKFPLPDGEPENELEFITNAYNYMMYNHISLEKPPIWMSVASVEDFFGEDYKREICLHIRNIFDKHFRYMEDADFI